MVAVRLSVSALTLLAVLTSGCCARRCCCPEPEVSKHPVPQKFNQPETPSTDRYVVVVHGLGDEALAVRDLIADLGGTLPTFSSLSIEVLVPRSHAREAYLRILRSPHRDKGLLVEWMD